MVYHESFSLDSSLLSRQENVALKGNATQSSDFDGLVASNALDGGSVALDQDHLVRRSSTSITESKANSRFHQTSNPELDQDYITSVEDNDLGNDVILV